MDQRMTPQEERELIEEASLLVRMMSCDALIGTFQSVLMHCSFIATTGGDVADVGDAAAIEFTVLRTELEERGLIRFH